MNTTALALQKALESAQVCPAENTRQDRTKLRTRQLEIEKIELASILPVEGPEGRKAIQERINLLEEVVKDPTLEERYPRLSIEVLKWRNKQGFPLLVPFSISNPEFSIGRRFRQHPDWTTSWETTGTFLQLPPELADLYEDVIGQLQNDCMASRSQFETITARFTGLIPQWVREKIQQASLDFTLTTSWVEIEHEGGWWWRKREVTKTKVTQNIFLIAEVDEWQVDKGGALHQDPLVVGYKGGCFWLICSFNETPLENYVRLEFTDQQT